MVAAAPNCRQSARVPRSCLRGLLSNLEIGSYGPQQGALGGTKVLGKGWSDILSLTGPVLRAADTKRVGHKSCLQEAQSLVGEPGS